MKEGEQRLIDRRFRKICESLAITYDNGLGFHSIPYIHPYCAAILLLHLVSSSARFYQYVSFQGCLTCLHSGRGFHFCRQCRTANSSCKSIPGSANWPSQAHWHLNVSITRKLIALIEPGAACHLSSGYFNNQ